MNEQKPFWLRNMIVPGQGAPNRIKKIGGRQGRCVCLWSKEKGYCRIYPVPYGYVHDWEIIDVEVRKPTNDGRENSFVIYNYENEWNNLSKRIHVHKYKNRFGNVKSKQLTRDEQVSLVQGLTKDTFSGIRDGRKSFGLIKPEHLRFILKKNREKSQAQTLLADLDNLVMDQNDYAWLPYLEYFCKGDCISKHPHRQKIVEWGAYQFMKQNPNDKDHCEKLSDNYHIGDSEYEHYVLIGNIRQYPTTYIVVKLIRFKSKYQ